MLCYLRIQEMQEASLKVFLKFSDNIKDQLNSVVVFSTAWIELSHGISWA